MRRTHKPSRQKKISIYCWFCGYDFVVRTGTWIICRCPACKKEIPNQWNYEIKEKLQAIRKNLSTKEKK